MASSSDSQGYADTKVALLIQETPNGQLDASGNPTPTQGVLIHAKNAYGASSEKLDIGEENIVNMQNLIKNPEQAQNLKKKQILDLQKAEIEIEEKGE